MLKDRKPAAAGDEDKNANRKSVIRDLFGR